MAGEKQKSSEEKRVEAEAGDEWSEAAPSRRSCIATLGSSPPSTP